MLPERWPAGWQVLPHDAWLLDGRLEPVPNGYLLRPEGKLPNFSAPWEAGDVILYAPYRPLPHQRAIQRFQGVGLGKEHRCWTHAAVYAGNGRILDAIGERGVGSGMVSDLTRDGVIRVRRVKDRTLADRSEIVSTMEPLISQKYDRLQAMMAGLKNLSPQPWRDRFKDEELPTSGFYCTQLIEIAMVAATGSGVRDKELPLPVPASFSKNETSFDDVPAAGWRRPRR
jgi:hypothetical protein